METNSNRRAGANLVAARVRVVPPGRFVAGDTSRSTSDILRSAAQGTLAATFATADTNPEALDNIFVQ